MEHLQTIIAGQGSEIESLRNKVSHSLPPCRQITNANPMRLGGHTRRQGAASGDGAGCHAPLTGGAERFRGRGQALPQVGSIIGPPPLVSLRVPVMSSGGSCGCGSSGLSKEKMRTLYYELGKRQSDNHSLALSLAESHNACDRLRAESKSLQQTRDDNEREISQLKAHNELMSNRLQKGNDDLSTKERHNNDLKELNVSLQTQIEEISYRYSEHKSRAERELQEKASLLMEAEALATSKRGEAEGLRARVDLLQQAVRQMEAVSQVSEQRLQAEWEQLAAERAQLAERLKGSEAAAALSSALEAEVHSLRREREDAASKSKQLVASYEARLGEEKTDVDALRGQVNDLKTQVSALRAQEQKAAGERDEAMKALLQTVDAARELSIKFQKERSRRVSAEERAIAAEKAAEGLKKSKESVSGAVLDALHKERSKTLALEQALNSLSVDRRYGDFISLPGAVPPSPEPMARMPPMPAFSSSTATPVEDMNSLFGSRDQSTPVAAAAPPVAGMVEELKKLRAELSNLEKATLSPLSESFQGTPSTFR